MIIKISTKLGGVLSVSVRTVRQLNAFRVMREFYSDKAMSRLDICKKTNLSPATVSSIVGSFLNQDLIKEVGHKESQGGRPQQLLDINGDKGFLIGVEMSENKLHIEFFNLRLKKQCSSSAISREDFWTAEDLGRQLRGLVDQMLINSELKETQCLGMGIGIPGIVKKDDNYRVHAPKMGWEHEDLIGCLQRFFPFPLLIDNGANALAIAELSFGVGFTGESHISLLLGDGLGVGATRGMQLLRGHSNAMGEWGRLAFFDHQNQEPVQLETLYKRTTSSLSNPQKAKQLITRWQQGCRESEAQLEEITSVLIRGIVNIGILYDPQLIVVGGWLGLALYPFWKNSLEKRLRILPFSSPFMNVKIRPSKLGKEGICIGGGAIVLNHILGNHF